jgi:biopolymer transport protein ExbD
MKWSVRHQGSPRQVDGLSLAELIQGLQDGLWDATDEVKGPNDSAWVTIEEHPQLADAVHDLDPLEIVHVEDQTHLDMNALIDVCLVLLIFFILTTSYQTLEKVLAMPATKPDDPGAVKVVAQTDVENYMILVKARKEDGKAVVWVEGEEVPEAQLQTVLSREARKAKKQQLLLDASGVDYGTVIKIIDAAGSANIEQVHFLSRPT